MASPFRDGWLWLLDEAAHSTLQEMQNNVKLEILTVQFSRTHSLSFPYFVIGT
jgi:hypothetical protein